MYLNLVGEVAKSLTIPFLYNGIEYNSGQIYHIINLSATHHASESSSVDKHWLPETVKSLG